MKAIERIFQYIEKKKLNKSEFERNSKISNGYLSKQLRRKADIGESILNNILENCPDINPEWLLTGKGNMLKDNKDISINTDNTLIDRIAQQAEQIGSLKNQIETLNETITALRSEQERYKKENSELRAATASKPVTVYEVPAVPAKLAAESGTAYKKKQKKRTKIAVKNQY